MRLYVWVDLKRWWTLWPIVTFPYADGWRMTIALPFAELNISRRPR